MSCMVRLFGRLLGWTRDKRNLQRSCSFPSLFAEGSFPTFQTPSRLNIIWEGLFSAGSKTSSSSSKTGKGKEF